MKNFLFHSFWVLLLKYCRDKRGAVLPIIAMMFPILLGMVGLGTDASLWMAQKRELQISADAAVIAAGWELAQENEDGMHFAALKEAKNNGYQPEMNGVLTLEILGSDADGTRISVTLEQDADIYFSKIIWSDPVKIAARAEALVSGVDGEFCILALEEEDPGALSTFGSVEIESPDCGLAVNSTDDEALTMSGNVDVEVGTVRISGDYDIGGSVDFVYSSLNTGVAPIEDPYADLEVPEHEGCDARNTRVNTNATFNPGVYCGGIDISGNNDVVFEPGVYIIDGGNFKITGGGSISGEGVTFILTGSGNDYADVDISGKRNIDLSAPTAGEDFAGIGFFQDRNAPQGKNLQNKITGSNDIIFDGVAYFPSQGLWFGGNTEVLGMDDPCTKFIARTVTLAGNPRMGNSCDNYDVEETGMPSVKLVK